MCNGSIVKVSLRDESIVAWDVSSSLGGSHGKLVVLVTLRLSLVWQLDSRVVAMGANGCLELSLIVTALGRVGLTVITPDRARGNSHWCSHL